MAKFNVVVMDQKIVDSYITKFTQNELNNEEWEPLSNISLDNINKYRDKLLLKYNYIYVSTLGRLAILKDGIFYLHDVQINEFGYLYTSFTFKDFCRHYFIHRLVALLYIKNKNLEEYDQINHIDEIKINNRKENLQWCNTPENCNYGNRNKNLAISKSKNQIGIDSGANARKIIIEKNKCAIICTNLITNEQKEYNSIKEAALDTNSDKSSISRCCRGKINSTNGYKFEYLNKNDNKSHSQSKFIDESIIRIDPSNSNNYKIYLSRDQINSDNFKVGRVRECCDGKHHIYYEYIWKYLSKYNEELKNNNLDEIKINIKIQKIKDDKVIEIFDIYDLCNDKKYSLNSIIMCCDGKIDKYKSFNWKYLN